MPIVQQPIDRATWTELFNAASQLAALEPWRFATEGDVFGLTDLGTGEVRLGHILGDAEMVFAAVVYRKGGVRWLLSTLDDKAVFSPEGALEAMDCVKLEWVLKRELEKEDLAAVAASGVKIQARGPNWPQFRSSRPGWHPWHLNAGEARQMVSDLRQLTAMLRVFKARPDFFDGRALAEVPFLRAGVSDREPGPDDLEWRSIVPPPEEPSRPVKVAESDLARLRALKRIPDLCLDFDARLMPTASFIQDGRPCFGRVGLAVETEEGMAVGVEVQGGDKPVGEAAVSCLIAILLKIKVLPACLNVGTARFKTVLQPLCSELGISLGFAEEMPFLEEAYESMGGDLMPPL